MQHAITIRGVTKRFGAKTAVDHLDLVVPTGALCGFIGPNGAGKTTTIRMIMSIIFPDSGAISVLGKSSAVESKDRIGYLPEERGVYRKMKVAHFLNYMGKLKGVDAKPLKRKVDDWIARVGLADSARKRCEELSKGMQQKVQFIASVIHEPDLLILDEVFSGLDPVNRRLMRDLIDEQSRAGRTIVFSTHAMYEAEQLCDRLFMIHRGHKVLDATLDEVHERFDPKLIDVEPMAGAGGAGGAGGVGGVGANNGRAAAALAAIPGVREVFPDREGTALHLRLVDHADAPAVMARVAQAVPVRRIELKRPSLEDIFIDLVEATGERPPAREELGRDALEAAAPAGAGGEGALRA